MDGYVFKAVYFSVNKRSEEGETPAMEFPLLESSSAKFRL